MSDHTEHMLTTVDNPFNPFTHFDEWYSWDIGHGYRTSEYLARVLVTSDELSPTDQSLAIEYAIDEILEANGEGFYMKIPEPTPEVANSS